MGCIIAGTILQYACVICAACLTSLQKILMLCCWTYSILSLNMSNHMSRGYLGIRGRVFVDDEIKNFHVLVVLIFEGHSGKAMFNIFKEVFNVLNKKWQNKTLLVATNREAKMTGWLSGWAICIAEVASDGSI